MGGMHFSEAKHRPFYKNLCDNPNIADKEDINLDPVSPHLRPAIFFHWASYKLYVSGNEPVERHFTHVPRAITMKLWEPKRKRPKAVSRHLQNHVVWSPIHKCSVKSYVTRCSTKCCFKENLFMRVLTHDKTKQTNGCERSEWCHGLPVCVRPISKRWFLKTSFLSILPIHSIHL